MEKIDFEGKKLVILAISPYFPIVIEEPSKKKVV